MSAYEYFKTTQFVVQAVLERGWEELLEGLKGELEFFVEFLIDLDIPLEAETVVQAWLVYNEEVSVTPRFPSAKLKAQVYEKYGYKCTVCGSTHKLHIDHVIPYAKFGKTVFENLTVLCSQCNESKNDRCF